MQYLIYNSTVANIDPYSTHPEQMRVALEDPCINRNEHDIYAPSFKDMLPPGGFFKFQVRSVLDFGCGAGNFTAEIAERFPHAKVVAADKSGDIFDKEKYGKHIQFIEWDGQTELNIDQKFDLITAKMSLHYLSPTELVQAMQNLLNLLSNDGELAISMPFSGYTSATNGSLAKPENVEVGNTGFSATITNYPIPAVILSAFLPDNYYLIIDQQPNQEGNIKRANVLLFPKEKTRSVNRRLRKVQKSTEKWDLQTLDDISTQLRVVSKWLLDQHLQR